MLGLVRLMAAFSLLIAAIYGLIYLWTGVLPDHGLKVLATVAIVTVLSLAIILLSTPTGSNSKP